MKINKFNEVFQALRNRSAYRFLFMLVALFMLVMPASAQSVSISLDPSDLDGFFNWFNVMFDAVLPVALVGAGLFAGVGFAFLVANMLKKAFAGLTGKN